MTTEELYAAGIEEGDNLLALSINHLDEVSRGLERMFGCTLQLRGGRLWLTDVESGSALRLKPEATVANAWKAAGILDETRNS